MQESVRDVELLTVDELAQAAGLSVRTVRYYASLGLLPPPEERGRVALYNDRHLARLRLVRALQGHGSTLAAIREYVEELPADATAEEIDLQRVMVTPWSSGPAEVLSRRALERRHGRRLEDEEIAWLLDTGALKQVGDDYELQLTFDSSAQLLDLDIPLDAAREAGEEISRQMEQLVDTLTGIVHTKILAPYRAEHHTEEERARFEHSLTKLRQLTLEALASAFQRASNETIVRAVQRRDEASRRMSSGG